MNNKMNFHFRLFPEKTDYKIFQKNPKKPFGLIFSANFGNNEFS